MDDLSAILASIFSAGTFNEMLRRATPVALAAIDELRRRHRMHTLVGKWKGNNECHVANAGDWLIVWKVCDGVAFFQRTGSHDEIFSSRPPLK